MPRDPFALAEKYPNEGAPPSARPGYEPASAAPPITEFPVMAEEAFTGLAGDIARMIEPHTESDRAGLLLSSHAPLRPSDQTCGCNSVAPAKLELWALGRGTLAPDGELATFSAPDWRWRPSGGRFSPDGRFAFSTSS